jgi:inorganic pyrophosphatase
LIDGLPSEVEVTIEVPRGGFVKRDQRGRIDVISPLPSPINYGSILSIAADDGDPLDAVVLGRRRHRGERVVVPVIGVVRFMDAGHRDDKVLCGHPWPGEVSMARAFFRIYGWGKRLANRVRGRRGATGVSSPRG